MLVEDPQVTLVVEHMVVVLVEVHQDKMVTLLQEDVVVVKIVVVVITEGVEGVTAMVSVVVLN